MRCKTDTYYYYYYLPTYIHTHTHTHLIFFLSSYDRRPLLGKLTLPVLILHGSADPVVPLKNGLSTHAAIPGAKLVVVEHMKHLLPRKHFPTVINALIEHRALVAKNYLGDNGKAVGNHEVKAQTEV